MPFNIPFSSGVGGVFIPNFHSGKQQVNSGSSGTLLTLTPPAGERVRLTMYSPLSTNSESNMQLNIAGAQVCLGSLTGSSNVTGDWCVSLAGASFTSPQNDKWSGYLPEIIGGVDEVITVVKTSGTTGTNHYYGYQTGVLK